VGGGGGNGSGGGSGGNGMMGMVSGSHDDGDPYTTNLYVGNLAPDVTEQARLCCSHVLGARALPLRCVRITHPHLPPPFAANQTNDQTTNQ
jgi:hypothetical protein